jgi:hypothetical protein
MSFTSGKYSAAGHKKICTSNGHNTFLKEFHSADLNPGPLAHHGQPPGKIKRVADHFAKSPIKGRDFGKIYFPQTRISFLGITLFVLFDPQTPLPSLAVCGKRGCGR